jgi:phytoene/squalene synthetase
MIRKFHAVSNKSSEITTKEYSTSFSSAIRLLHHDMQQPIYNIYGFVRFADEIVDTFHDYDKRHFWRNLKRILMQPSKGDQFKSNFEQLSANSK